MPSEHRKSDPATFTWSSPAATRAALVFAAGIGATQADGAELLAPEPADQVRSCPEAGPGFVRLPGTDVCLRVGGEVFGQAYAVAGRELSITTDYANNEPTATYQAADLNEGLTSLYADGTVSVQAQSDTEAGTLFASLELRGTSEDMDLDEAYVSFKGFTAGYRYSAFDVGTGYNETAGLSSDRTTNLVAYTVEVRPNVNLTISAEEGTLRRLEDNVWAQYGGQRIPDLIGALDVNTDRDWLHAAAAAHHITDLRGGSEEIGLAGILGASRRFRYGDEASGRVLVTGAVARGALDYLGIPLNAPDYIRDAGGKLQLTTGFSGLVSYEHYWSAKFRSAATASFYRTHTDVDSLKWRSQGAWLTLGSEYIPVEDFTLGVDVTYYWDQAGAESAGSPAPAEAEAVTAIGYVRRVF